MKTRTVWMVTMALAAVPLHAQSAKFEVASVKQNLDCGRLPVSAPEPGPGRLVLTCIPVESLLYVAFTEPTAGFPRLPIEGAPDWTRSELYTVEALADPSASQAEMRGPMLRALLEERFRLKAHVETRQVPVYELVVARSGSKLRQAAEECAPLTAGMPRGEKRPCHVLTGMGPTPGSLKVDLESTTVETFANRLSNLVERPVIDQTGLSGTFDIVMEFAPDQATPRSYRPERVAPDPTKPGVFTAIQEQLGLKLDSARGPGKVLVVDQIERPTEN